MLDPFVSHEIVRAPSKAQKILDTLQKLQRILNPFRHEESYTSYWKLQRLLDPSSKVEKNPRRDVFQRVEES